MAMTPVRNCLCAQDYLEPVLRDFAERQGPGELRFSTEVTAVQQDGAAVTATLVNRAAGTGILVRTQYLIAADGAQSPIRRMLGVTMTGREAVYDSVNILFHADLRQWTAHRPAALYAIDDDGAVLVRPDGHVAWRSRSGSDDPAGTLQAAIDGVLGLASR
jgi:2-polyprenyl-6-methoxyphenol hydroxylase-like FAD-dependent oxidoreductase